MHLTDKGSPFPLGGSRDEKGVNLAVFAERDTLLTLHIFDHEGKEIVESHITHQTGAIFHIKIFCPPEETILYTYQFANENKWLVDPYAKALLTPTSWGQEPYVPIAIALPANSPALNFDWGNSKKPNLKREDLILYEMHVRGFTKSETSGLKKPGTFLALIEKIPHLKSLGVNAVELMPVHEFHESEVDFIDPQTNKVLTNYWGYSTVSFFSLMNRYAASDDYGSVLQEFKQLIKALHENQIEVILDVVYNHTAEGNEKGPVYHFKSFAKSTYYILEKDEFFSNYSGCGNTLSCNEPAVIELIISSLRYFAVELQVDGFRFDLTSIFSRQANGHPTWPSAIIEAITKDPVLKGVKLFAEPWDAAGLYQLGAFANLNSRWSEWNGKYRDSIRKFIKGSVGSKGEFATRIAGSSDLFGGASPLCSVNFVTVHDGFTLMDLVSYNHKHNEANGEDNRDGTSFNDSWNCGVEGQTTQESVLLLRKKQIKNFITALMVSKGVPLLLMGDECAHTKFGNNNTWCQDNNLNYFDWNRLESEKEFYRFFQKLVHWRKQCPIFQNDKFYQKEDISWHGLKLENPNWDDLYPFLSFTLHGSPSVFVAFNAGEQVLEIETPFDGNNGWKWLVNTALDTPFDFVEESSIEEGLPHNKHYVMPAYSAIILVHEN